MKIEAKFTHDKVNHAEENEIHAVISLTAPKIDWEKQRAPICIVPVIDISGSMQGEKLNYAKQSVMKLIENLQPGDYCGLVAFGSEVYPISEPVEMTQVGKDILKAKVGNLECIGCTNFSGGMRKALEWINKADLSNKYILRAMMFTDGMPNQGEAQDIKSLCNLFDTLKGRATLSAFGYGSNCNQELMADLAKHGGGSYYFVEDPDAALTAFARELGGLLSRYAHNITIEASPFNGHEITNVVSDVDTEEDGNKVKITLPEILSEEERYVVLALKLSKQSKPLPRALNVLDVKVTYDRIEDGKKTSHKETVKAKLKFVKPGDEQTEATEAVALIVSLHKTIEAQVEAEEQANAGNFAGAQAVMRGNADWIMGNFNSPEAAQFSYTLADKMENNAVYACSSGYRNSSKGLSRGVDLSHNPLAQDVDYFIPVGSSSTSAQDEMVEKFAQKADVVGITHSSSSDAAAPITTSNVVISQPEEKKKKSKSKSSRW
jgi:Ca-activated chloride channel family protein